MNASGLAWALGRPYMIQRLEEIAAHGRVKASTDAESSARAQILVRRGFAERAGLCWSRIHSTRQVAAYSPTKLGDELLELSRKDR